MSMRTIKIPEGSYNTIMSAIYSMSSSHRDNGWDALSDEAFKLGEQLEVANGGLTEDMLPRVSDGCHCDCANRDADEIAVYLDAHEMLAIQWALHKVRFGDLEDDQVRVVELYRGMRELDEVIETRLEE